MTEQKNTVSKKLVTALLQACKRKPRKPTPGTSITTDPKTDFLGGRVSKKVIWIGGLLLAVVLSMTVAIIAGKGQHNVPDDEDATEAKSGSDTQAGLNDILAGAPDSPAIKAADSTDNTGGTPKDAPKPSGTGAGNGASGDEKEDPAIRQARLAAEREIQRIGQLREQQFEAALASNGRVSVDLDNKDSASASDPKSQYMQAASDLKNQATQLAAKGQQSTDPNKQDDKIAFSEATHSNTYLTKGRETPVSDSELKVGTVIPSTLISGINSDLPGQVIAQVNQNVYDSATHSQILLPQGAKLYGVYDSRIAYGQDRLLMAWTRVNFPDGTTLELNGMGGTDTAGYAGFADQVDHHYFKIFGNAFLLGLISGGMESAVSNDGDDEDTNSSVSDGVVQQFGTVGSSLIQKNLDVQPTITIRNGYTFNIMLNKDVVLPPYQPMN